MLGLLFVHTLGTAWLKFPILGVTSILKGKVLHAGHVRPSVCDLLERQIFVEFEIGNFQ